MLDLLSKDNLMESFKKLFLLGSNEAQFVELKIVGKVLLIFHGDVL